MFKTLTQLKSTLDHQAPMYQGDYFVPKIWNKFDYPVSSSSKIINVNPYAFYSAAIQYILDHQAPLLEDYRQASYYSTMIRTNTTFDHDLSGTIPTYSNQGFIETGSFIKMIAYLPTLKKMGVNVIYLLPIMQFSKMDKKGDLGSVYGVSHFFQIDPALFDPIAPSMTIELQFKAFIEACHAFGMRVMLDIIPRTHSVNTDLIMQHPEWFYWIDLKSLADYKPPLVPSLPMETPILEDNLIDVYQSKEVRTHINQFRPAPNLINPILFDQVVAIHQENPTIAPLTLIREHFNMTIAPAFSDQINDVQPAWSDVTFFRLYLDHPLILKTLAIQTPDCPYILFDTIKANRFKGAQPNMPLWDMLSDILPYYIEQFNLDGARIDMGHALPSELTTLIIDKAKALNPDFYFIAEVLSTTSQPALEAKSLGYDLIIGDGFYHTHRFDEGLPRDFYYQALNAPITIFAAGETHDTPRLISRKGGYHTLRFVSILNQFAYNLVPFINSGQELLEQQPMNTGVDSIPDGAFILDSKDPYYGKLALFDTFAFHYENDYEPFILLLEKIAFIKKTYQALLLDISSVHYVSTPNKEQIIFHYQDQKTSLYILAHASLSHTTLFNLHLDSYDVLFNTSSTDDLILGPLDIMILIERKTQ